MPEPSAIQQQLLPGKLLAEQWEEFDQMVIPDDARADQRRSIWRAFYACAQSMLHTIEEGFIEASPEESLALLRSLRWELVEFAMAVRCGHA